MITDLVIGIGYSILAGLLAVLPDAGEPPEAMRRVFAVFAGINQIFPAQEFMTQVLPVMLVGGGGSLLLWRVIRFIRGG